MSRRSVAAWFERDGRVFLAQRLPGGSMGGRWELPGGKVEGDETLAQALAREMAEEFGLMIEVGVEIGATQFRHAKADHELHVLRATIVGGWAALDQAKLVEHAQSAWFTYSQLATMSAQIVDSDWAVIRARWGR